ncbi:MAG: hypothetical protein HY964_08775 [Ignavibacteriales bacterium]|nr:hypothetical protein [Ignavibacteriales bacterium]
MKSKIIIYSLLILFLEGCLSVKETYDKPPNEWNSNECLLILSNAISHNLFDNRTNIKIIATPYYPSVILALYRNRNEVRKWTMDQYKIDVDELMKYNAGLYYDWTSNKIVDSKGNYFKDKTQIDSLMFMISITNLAYYSAGSMMQVKVGGAVVWMPLVSPDQIYTPEISRLEENIFLTNDQSRSIKPKYVWGKKNTMLTTEETLFVMFNLRAGDNHFLSKSESIYLLIKGFEEDIILTFPLKYLK